MTANQDNNKTPKFSIQSVTDNKEKQISYKENLKRFKEAEKSGFYLECLWIIYAMIEDRTSAFLYYIGFTSNGKRSSVTGTHIIKKEIQVIFGLEGKTNIKYKFNTLGGKFVRIKELLTWCKAEHETLSKYQHALIKVIQPVLESNEFNEALNYLESEWRDKRNQLTHALFNKNPNAVFDELRSLVEQGFIAARHLDEGVKKVKNHNNIRLKFKIQ